MSWRVYVSQFRKKGCEFAGVLYVLSVRVVICGHHDELNVKVISNSLIIYSGVHRIFVLVPRRVLFLCELFY